MQALLKRAKTICQERQGAVAVLAALAMVVLLMFTAATVDMGSAYVESARLQAALDAGALAGAAELPDHAAAQAAALDYVSRNGYSPEEVSLTISGDTLSLTGAREKPTNFLQIIGLRALTISEKAAARCSAAKAGGVWDYRIFSGSESHTLDMGGRFDIDGSVHSNGGLSISPGYGRITGAAEARTYLYVNQWTTTVGSQDGDAAYIGMPDFSDSVDGVMPAGYSLHTTGSALSAPSNKQYWDQDMYVTGSVTVKNQVEINGDVYIQGDFTVKGGKPVCVLNGNLYVDGNITFENDTHVYGSVFATGNITFKGGGMSVSPSTAVCVYSATGNITMTMASSVTHGVVYAPQGTVSLAGNNTTFYGSIVGDKVTGIPANLVMGESSLDFPFLSTDTRVSLVE